MTNTIALEIGALMKILSINASPRMEAGNTQLVLTPFLVGARSKGAEIDVAYLGRKDIKRCIGCFTCYAKTPGVCVHSDDMPKLIERIRSADMLVLGTPIYLDGMTALAKTFIDRLVVFLDPHFITDAQGFVHPLRWNFPARIFLVSVCGYPGLHNFEPLVTHMERFARNLHSHFCGSLLRPAIFSMQLTKKYPDRIHRVMDAIRTAGEELVQAGSVSDATLRAASQDICAPEELLSIANKYWDRELEKSTDQPA
uniref:Flavodoxin family protein n=1 Tax=Desulfomonile tiedjei TaxID=2358 RepID=A0A7C4EU52_9BACT